MTDEIRVTSQKHTQTFQQTIAPGSRDKLLGLIDSLLMLAKSQRTNGRIAINLKQGGVRNVIVEAFEEAEEKLSA